MRIHPYPVWPDDRGYFLEIARIGQGLPAGFPKETTQISAALSYPGTIKAFHFHRHQTDCWVPLDGMLQVALVDLRAEFATFGVRNTLYVGALRRWQLLVPPGIAHGYKVIGTDPAMLVYLTDRFYDPQDEGRIRVRRSPDPIRLGDPAQVNHRILNSLAGTRLSTSTHITEEGYTGPSLFSIVMVTLRRDG